MENSPFDTNNPYKRTPKSQSTLPLEPRVPREEQEANASYMPKPPKPEDFQEKETQAPRATQPLQKNNAAATGNPEQQHPNEANPRKTVNFMAQPGPRQYEVPASYGQQPAATGVPQERPTQPPASGLRPRPTVTYQPGQQPETQGRPNTTPHATQPYPAPARPDQTKAPESQHGYRQTMPAGNPTIAGNNNSRNSGYRPTVRDTDDNKNKGSLGLIIGIVAAALLIIGGGCWWYFGYRNSHPIVTDDIDIEEVAEITYSDGKYDNPATEPTSTGGASQSSAASQGATSTETPGVGSGMESTSLFNRTLTYTGAVNPGGVATLNVILFQNGRLEGSIDYSDGKSMPLFGSYTWTDNGHTMNINFTVSSKKDKTYSESWMGHSSYIKDDLAHTLTFKRINTSTGQSMTASFALRP